MARRIVRPDLSTLPDISRGLDAQGRLIQAGPGDPEANIVIQSDRTEQRVPAVQDAAAYAKPLPIILPAQHLDALAVAQVAMYRVLSGSTYHGIDLAQYIVDGIVEAREFQLDAVFFDHAGQEQEAQPQTVATVMQGGFLPYDNAGLQTVIQENTIDQFLRGTALRQTATARVPLIVEFRTAHKEERRGIRAGLERTFHKEPHDDRVGRRIVVREYFDQEVRIIYQGQDQEDGSENAQANRWVVAARFEVTLDVVELVGTPEFIDSVHLDLVLNEDC